MVLEGNNHPYTQIFTITTAEQRAHRVSGQWTGLMMHKAVTVAEVAVVVAEANLTMATAPGTGVLDTLLSGGTPLEDLSDDVLGKSRKQPFGRSARH